MAISLATAIIGDSDSLLANGAKSAASFFSSFAGSDVISIALFGFLFLLFGYAAVFGYYLKKLGDIQNGQENLYSVVGKAIFLQIASLVLIWTLLMSLSFFSKYSVNSSMGYQTATILFFKVDWLNVDMPSAIDAFKSDGSDVNIFGILLMIQAIWLVLTVMFLAIPVAILISIAFYMKKKHLEQKFGDSSIYVLISDNASLLLITIIIFAFHFTLPAVFLEGMYKDNQSNVNKYTSSLETFDDFSYRARIKKFIEDSYAFKDKQK